MGWFCWGDPGPCPVDDTPHTACTAASAGSSLTVRAYRPRVLDVHRMPPVVETPPLATFTTGTYRRAVHGKAIREARAAAERKRR